jgi:hypothetical protein
MGATAKYRAISSWALELLKAHPWLVEVVVCGRSGEGLHDHPVMQAGSEAFNLKLDVLRKALAPEMSFPEDRDDMALKLQERRNPAAVDLVRPHLARLRSEWQRPALDLDKAWRWILEHAQTAGAEVAQVCQRALRGGSPLGPDLGYGPAHLHDVLEVAALAAALPAAVTGYAASGGEHLSLLEAVRDHYAAAARSGEAMLVYLV